MVAAFQGAREGAVAVFAYKERDVASEAALLQSFESRGAKEKDKRGKLAILWPGREPLLSREKGFRPTGQDH